MLTARFSTGPHSTIDSDDGLDSAEENTIQLGLTLAHGFQALTSDDKTNVNVLLELWLPSRIRLPSSDSTRIKKISCVCKLA
jgi:hypothetical protein